MVGNVLRVFATSAEEFPAVLWRREEEERDGGRAAHAAVPNSQRPGGFLQKPGSLTPYRQRVCRGTAGPRDRGMPFLDSTEYVLRMLAL